MDTSTDLKKYAWTSQHTTYFGGFRGLCTLQFRAGKSCSSQHFYVVDWKKIIAKKENFASMYLGRFMHVLLGYREEKYTSRGCARLVVAVAWTRASRQCFRCNLYCWTNAGRSAAARHFKILGNLSRQDAFCKKALTEANPDGDLVTSDVCHFWNRGISKLSCRLHKR